MAVLCVAALALAGCSPEPLPRTLPRHITRVHVPIFHSNVFEPGLEELVTQYTVDKFLADGRIRPVGLRQSDMVLEGQLRRWEERTTDRSSEEFELIREVKVRARVYAYSPEDELKQDPLYVWDGIEASASFLIDPRFIGEVVPADSKRILMEDLAREIVRAVIEGKPETGEAAKKLDKRLEDPGPRYEPVESLRERRLRQRGQAPLRVAF